MDSKTASPPSNPLTLNRQMIAKQDPRLMLTGMAKLAHESSSFVNNKELQRVKMKGGTQGLLDAFATPRASRHQG
jgi:hypothetical protein